MSQIPVAVPFDDYTNSSEPEIGFEKKILWCIIENWAAQEHS